MTKGPSHHKGDHLPLTPGSRTDQRITQLSEQLDFIQGGVYNFQTQMGRAHVWKHVQRVDFVLTHRVGSYQKNSCRKKKQVLLQLSPLDG